MTVNLYSEFLAPVLEVDNAIFLDGILYLNNPDTQSLSTINNIRHIHASQDHFLPASLAQFGDNTFDWIPGPKIKVFNNTLPSVSINCLGWPALNIKISCKELFH